MSQIAKIIAISVFGVLFSAASASASALASNVAAKKDGVKILKAPKKGSGVVATLKKGEVVESTARKGMYWSVNVKGKPGFVSVMKVKRQKGNPSSLTNAIRSVVKQGRDASDEGSSRTRSAVMGVRGLDESDETAFAGNAKPNLRMVYIMEDLVTDEKTLEAFGENIFAEIEKKVE